MVEDSTRAASTDHQYPTGPARGRNTTADPSQKVSTSTTADRADTAPYRPSPASSVRSARQ